MAQHRRSDDVGDHPVKKIDDDDEEVRTQWVSLKETAAAVDPRPGHAIE
jgi:hypothetical protein